MAESPLEWKIACLKTIQDMPPGAGFQEGKTSKQDLIWIQDLERENYISAKIRMGYGTQVNEPLESFTPNLIFDVHLTDKGRQLIAVAQKGTNSSNQINTNNKFGKEENNRNSQQVPSSQGNDGVQSVLSDNIFRILASISIVSWMIHEFIPDIHKIFLFLAIAFGLADAFYVLAHKILKKAKWTVLCWLVYTLVLAAIFKNEAAQNPNPPLGMPSKPPDFSVVVLTTFIFEVSGQNTSGMMYIHNSNPPLTNGWEENPINAAVYVQVRNLQSIESMIDLYSYESEYDYSGTGKWEVAKLASPVDGGVFWAGMDPTKASYIFPDSFLDSKIQGKNFQPGETVEGWVFFRNGFGPKFRLHVQDSSGNTSDAYFEIGKTMSDRVSAVTETSSLHVSPPTNDISHVPIKP